ncbi:YdcF family protein [Methylobacterium sp. Leaf112]|uniref:YdcF family protein n=1 Tax=Methylobacterium sp. Leaf112 TaxID=1736258 RepID=UPI0006F92263|nr:YdcF family protein [Methylobacterium sp. Leaf112]KQP59565.1 hypothetical protein ASF52_11685 [Methylobacterium sp. Leaf112]
MFFPFSKLIFFVITPSNALILAVVAGMLLIAVGRWRRFGRVLAGAAGLGLLVAGFSPLALWVALPLEDRFPAFVDDGTPVTGIVVLGGGVETRLSAARDQFVVNDAGERQLALIDLSRRYPDARLAFTGGSAALRPGEVSEAEIVGRTADGLGLPRTRLILENRSRNTRENAAFTADLVKPKPGERWLLVTSAWHMPRAVGCFRAAGFTVAAYPVDYRTAGPRDAVRFNSFASDGLALLDVVVKEWIGLVVYRLAGYTDAWMPAPQASSVPAESTSAAGSASR